MKNLLVLLACILCLGCAKKQPEEPIETDDIACLCPHALIYLQPYEDFTKEEAKKLVPKLQKEFDTWLDGAWEFKVLDPISLPEGSKVSNKYVAVRILSKQNEQPLKGNELIIGLTHKDICAHVHGVQYYGIVGLSFSPGNVCVVSDKRLKNKTIFWKPILHEFMHAFYGAKHCKNDDPTCFMVDAKGRGTFNIQDKLCDSCKP